MPETAIQPVEGECDLPLSLSPVKGRHQRQNLSVLHPRFHPELVIADAGVSISNLDNPVQDILSIRAAIQLLFLGRRAAVIAKL
jgi:hypothetical protein